MRMIIRNRYYLGITLHELPHYITNSQNYEIKSIISFS